MLTWCVRRIMVLGDTTVPGSHILLTASHIRDLHYIINQYGHADFAFGAFSTALFSALIQINHLRLRASRAGPTRTQTLTQEAFAVLQHIIDFSPETWASSKSCSRTDWLILGKVYRAAVVLYCICSLQSLGVLPESPSLMATRETHRQVLHALLSERMKHARFTLFVFWPTLVLGAEGGPQRRGFVHQQMDRVSFHMGTSMPLVAKAVLDDFWASGKTGWEDCFDREYGFLAALTVERSKV